VRNPALNSDLYQDVRQLVCLSLSPRLVRTNHLLIQTDKKNDYLAVYRAGPRPVTWAVLGSLHQASAHHTGLKHYLKEMGCW
jgi:hypothetical protein